jgi:hypothetical protein
MPEVLYLSLFCLGPSQQRVNHQLEQLWILGLASVLRYRRALCVGASRVQNLVFKHLQVRQERLPTSDLSSLVIGKLTNLTAQLAFGL